MKKLTMEELERLRILKRPAFSFKDSHFPQPYQKSFWLEEAENGGFSLDELEAAEKIINGQ